MVYSSRVLLVFFFLNILSRTYLLTNGKAKEKLKHLYWNTTNEIFLISNTDHIIDVNTGSTQNQYDQINIICPVYSLLTEEKATEKFVIYNVNREEYETCRILSPNPRIIAYCTSPYKERIFTISFRSFSPMPNSLEFHPGRSYYFMSTSSANDLHKRNGGFCIKNNMKVIFNIADTREPVRTYQLEHRSGSRINIVEDGIDDTKYLPKNQGLNNLSSSKNQPHQDASSANGNLARISVTVKVIPLIFIVLCVISRFV